MKKQRKLSLVKKEADKWFSLYIRLKYADWRGYVKCYTCSHTAEYNKGMQCGHFASRRHLSTRFDEENCRVQCMACNVFKRGNMNIFAEKLIKEKGADFISEINAKANQPAGASYQWWEEKLKEFKYKVEGMS